MKKWRGASIVMAGLLLLMGASAQISRVGTLHGAFAAGQIQATIRGTGGSSGDTIKMDVSKTSKAPSGPLQLDVTPGTRLDSSDRSAQSMVVASVRGRMVGDRTFIPESQIVVTSSKPVTYLLEAYCAEFEKDNPASSTHFKLRSPDSLLSCVLREANRRKLSVKAKQAAVWIVTDDITYDHMNEKFSVGSSEWSAAKAVVQHCRNKGL